MVKDSFYIDGAPRAFGGFQSEFSKSDFVLFGVPYDSTSSFRPGSRFGPRAMREVSANLETWSWRTGIDYEDVRLHDLGDVSVVHGDSEETIRRVQETVEDIRGARKVPILLGGEHTMTLGAVRAFKDATIVSFDAHFDLRDEYLSNRLSHACVMRRSSEEVGPGNVLVVGARASYADEIDFVKKKGIRYISSLDIIRSGAQPAGAWAKENLRGVKKLYISIDIDILDPSFAPGVGNPEPEGIGTTALLDILNAVVDERVVGFDVVEVSPPYDNGSTAAVASKLVFEVCSMMKSLGR